MIYEFEINDSFITFNGKVQKPVRMCVLKSYNFLKTSINGKKLFIKFLNHLFDENFNELLYKVSYFNNTYDIKRFVHSTFSPYVYQGKRNNIIHVYRQFGELFIVTDKNNTVLVTNNNSIEVKNIINIVHEMFNKSVYYDIIIVFIDYSLEYLFNKFVNAAVMPLLLDIRNNDVDKIVRNFSYNI